MTEEQRFLFDLNGFLIIENVLSAHECEELKEQVYKMKFSPEELPDEHRIVPGGKLSSLIDHPTLEPILKEVLGENIRFDFGFTIWRKKGDRHPMDLHHGGPVPEPMFHYRFRNGKIFSGLLRVVFELNDVNEGDGGTCFLPGSHKSNFHVPEGMKNIEQGQQSQFLHHLKCKAGSMIIFTENVAHGGPPWQNAQRPRVSIFFSYNHLGMQFHKPTVPQKLIDTLTDNQKKYFRHTWMHDFDKGVGNGDIQYKL